MSNITVPCICSTIAKQPQSCCTVILNFGLQASYNMTDVFSYRIHNRPINLARIGKKEKNGYSFPTFKMTAAAIWSCGSGAIFQDKTDALYVRFSTFLPNLSRIKGGSRGGRGSCPQNVFQGAKGAMAPQPPRSQYLITAHIKFQMRSNLMQLLLYSALNYQASTYKMS